MSSSLFLSGKSKKKKKKKLPAGAVPIFGSSVDSGGLFGGGDAGEGKGSVGSGGAGGGLFGGEGDKDDWMAPSGKKSSSGTYTYSVHACV